MYEVEYTKCLRGESNLTQNNTATHISSFTLHEAFSFLGIIIITRNVYCFGKIALITLIHIPGLTSYANKMQIL